MSIDQTSQLLQLILNSVLMLTTCVVIWGVLTVRHIAIHNRLRSLNQEYFELLNHAVMLRGDRLQQIRGQLQQFRQRYQITHLSLLVLYVALLLLGLSAFIVVLRSLLNWQWLITGSLLLFALGTGAMLVGSGFALLDFYQARQSVLEEMSWVLGLGDNAPDAKAAKAPQRPPRNPAPTKATPRKSHTKIVELAGTQR
ncbi:MAG: DUF2721 domain-containing protein [Oculatellaceae cyanobacterium bins.114]|nr:DUF2721 domain-containing protein [Oculatellaceae cyanobacterium bins.114]